MDRLSYTQLAKMTAGASGGLIAANAATSVSVMPTSGPQSTFGRTMRILVPLAATGGILYGLPQNQYTQGAAVGAAMTAVSQGLSMVTMMMSGGSGGGSGQEGLGSATRTAAMSGGVSGSRALAQSGMALDRSKALMEGEQTGSLEMD